MHGAFCHQQWPGNDAGDDPDIPRTVESSDKGRTRLIRCAGPMFCSVGLLSAFRVNNFGFFDENEKNQETALNRLKSHVGHFWGVLCCIFEENIQ